jgi:hypothetical protein
LRLRALLVVALMALACREKYDATRDVALKQTLAQMRGAIAKYRAEHGTHPPSLDALVPRYLPAVPADPFTGAKDWRLTTEESVQPSADFTTGSAASTSVVVDVHSTAPGADRNGTPYASY